MPAKPSRILNSEPAPYTAEDSLSTNPVRQPSISSTVRSSSVPEPRPTSDLFQPDFGSHKTTDSFASRLCRPTPAQRKASAMQEGTKGDDKLTALAEKGEPT